MTKERIEEIKKETIFRAGRKVKNLEFDSREKLMFELGEIFGELNRDLTRELNKELPRRPYSMPLTQERTSRKYSNDSPFIENNEGENNE